MRSRHRRTIDVRHPRLGPLRARATLTALRLRRSRLARRVGARRCLAAVLAVAVGVTVASASEQARHDREHWGTTRRVVVATVDVAAGEVLGGHNTRLEDRPAKVLPEGTVDTLPDGRRTSVDVPAGETILADRLAEDSVGALAARLPRGSAGVTFPRSDAQPALDVGDRVDIYASLSDVTGTASVRVAGSAGVVHLDERSVTVAVAEDEVRSAAAASFSEGVAFVVLR